MYEDILFPYDGSDGATTVLRHAADLARFTDGTITLLYVADTSHHSVTRVESTVVDGMVDEGRDRLEGAVAVLEDTDVDYETDVVQGTPAATIVEYADEYETDLIVMPTQGRSGLSRALLGSVTEKVVRLAETPVLTARMAEDERLQFPYEDILIPTDGSAAAEDAAVHALDFAATLDATVHAVSVVETATVTTDPTESLLEAAEDAAASALEWVADAAADRSVDCQTYSRGGSAGDGIVEAVAETDSDAVVMGTTGRRGIERVLLGSVAERTVRSAPVPVVTVADAIDFGTDM